MNFYMKYAIDLNPIATVDAGKTRSLDFTKQLAEQKRNNISVVVEQFFTGKQISQNDNTLRSNFKASGKKSPMITHTQWVHNEYTFYN